MAKNKIYTPLFLQFIQLVQKGFSLLDESSREEVREFVKNCQHKNGAFTNRSGNPDLYYSLFGVWLSAALELPVVIQKHKTFIQHFKPENKNGIDRFVIILIQSYLLGSEFKKPSVRILLKLAFRRGISLNVAYRFFLFLLTFDFLYGRKKILWFLARLGLYFYKPPQDSPSSLLAALTVAKFQVGLNVQNEIKQLFAYFVEGRGFKVFRQVENGDLLSTAVALFALNTVGADVRLVAPDCLDLIGQNYEKGAFLSGDGDLSRDLEYTFYGLFALGTLSSK